MANPRRALSPTYAAAELLWYMSGNRSTEMIEAYAPKYSQFAEKEGYAYGAYGWRLYAGCSEHQLDLVLQELATRPNSRQAVAVLWFPVDLEELGRKNDIPCTICWHFILRDNALNMNVYMRSNDIWLGMPYDVWVNTTIQRYMSAQLGVEPGVYTHFVGSLHLYERNEKAAREAVEMTWPTRTSCDNTSCDAMEELRWAVKMEREMRSHRLTLSQVLQRTMERGIGPLTQNILLAAGRQWYGSEVADYMTSPDLAKGILDDHHRRD